MFPLFEGGTSPQITWDFFCPLDVIGSLFNHLTLPLCWASLLWFRCNHEFQANRGKTKMPTGPRYCLMTDRWKTLQKKRFKKPQNLIKAIFCGGELSPCLETVQNFPLESFRQLLWFIKSAYWREGEGEKGCCYSSNRYSPKPYAKINPRRPGCIQGNLAAGLELAGWPSGIERLCPQAPAVSPVRPRVPERRPHLPVLGPHPFPPLSGVKIWFILLPLTLEGLSLTWGSAHPWAWREILDLETALLRTKSQ